MSQNLSSVAVVNGALRYNNSKINLQMEKKQTIFYLLNLALLLSKTEI